MRKLQISYGKIYFVFFLSIGFLFYAFGMSPAATTAAELSRTNEILDKEVGLRKRIEQSKKAFIKAIEVEGVSLLSAGQLEDMIAPYRKKWLTEEQIGHLLGQISDIYQEISPPRSPVKITYQIKKSTLLITVEE